MQHYNQASKMLNSNFIKYQLLIFLLSKSLCLITDIFYSFMTMQQVSNMEAGRINQEQSAILNTPEFM